MGFDATRKIDGDRTGASTNALPRIDDETEHRGAVARLAEAGGPTTATPDWGARRLLVLGQAAETPAEEVEAAVQNVWRTVGAESSAADLVIVVDDVIDMDDFDAVLFELTACADPERDRISDDATDGRRIAFDATSKAAGTHPSGARVRRYAPKQVMPGSSG